MIRCILLVFGGLLITVSAYAQSGRPFTANCAILGSTTVCAGATVTTITGLTLSGGTLSGVTTLPGSGQITSTGFLGLGVSPTYKLDVQETTAGGNALAFHANANNGSISSDMLLSHIGVQISRSQTNSSPILLITSTDNSSSRAVLQLKGNAGAVEVFFAAANGSVGIKNVNPQANLAIGTTAGTARIYNSFTDTSNGEWTYLGSWGPTANVATFGTDKNGSGVTRNIQFYVGGTNKLDYGITTAARWTTPDTFSASGYYAGATAGVSCAAGAVNPVTTVVTNGIITTC